MSDGSLAVVLVRRSSTRLLGRCPVATRYPSPIGYWLLDDWALTLYRHYLQTIGMSSRRGVPLIAVMLAASRLTASSTEDGMTLEKQSRSSDSPAASG
jgi:hypothetical protein